MMCLDSKNSRPLAAVLGMLLMMLGSGTALAETRIESGTDKEARLPFWQISDAGMSLRLVQRLPDQTRGYFQARGFSEADADLIANSCVFQTVFKNLSNKSQPAVLEYNLHDWVVIANGKKQGLKLREDWQPYWQSRGVAKPAQLAFEWSLYPTHQVYRPGDYNWGMSVFNLKPGTRFDLRIVWQQYGRQHRATIPNLECAPDVHPQPGSTPPP